MATQQEINDFVEQIMPYFDPAPVEEDTVQQSWPRLDRGLSDSQDMVRFQHQYGIFDHGGRPFWLQGHATDAITNERNTLFLTVSNTTGTAEATVRGAFYRLREDMELSFPAVSATTTYYVVVSYDPIRSEGGGDPLEVEVVTSLNTSQGRDYIVLWQLTRRPSQLLTDAVRTQVRPKVAPVITVDTIAQRDLMPLDRLVWGTVCLVHASSEFFRAGGTGAPNGGPNQWISVTAPDFSLVGYGSTYMYPGHGSQKAIAREGRRRILRGRWERANGSSFTTTSNGYLLWNLDPDDRPASEERRVVSGFNLASPTWGVVNVNAQNGEVRFHPAMTTSWVDIGELSYTVPR